MCSCCVFLLIFLVASRRVVFDAIPMVCDTGDVIISNRQIVHGSFANTGFEPRITANFGFHKRSSVLNVKGAGIHSEAAVYDDDFIKERSKAMGLALASRKKRFPEEESYNYKPLLDELDSFSGCKGSHELLKNYKLKDLSI